MDSIGSTIALFGQILADNPIYLLNYAPYQTLFNLEIIKCVKM